MNLQDRAYAAGIFIVIGICCIGAYVAVTGFMNSYPGGLSLSLHAPTTAATAEIGTLGPVETAAPNQSPLAPPGLTSTPPPIGFKPSPTSPTRGTPSPAFLADIPTITPAGTEVASPPTASAPAGCGSPFCPRLGGPSTDAPTGQPCPGNYLWGFVFDQSGKGLANMQVRYQQVDGQSDKTATKGPPDPSGRYDIPAGGGTWILELFDPNSGSALSPPFRVVAHQPYTGGPICPTRVDFVQQQ